MKINDKAREELFSEVNGLSDEDINKKPSEDQWSIKQIIEHLILMEGAVAQMVTDQLKNGEIVNADPKPIESSINRDVKVTAPDFATPSNDFATLDELKIKLTTTHQGLMGIEKNADEKELEMKGFAHPVFGQMSLKQWIPFVGYHERRHILQIKEVREQLGI
ncbi:hypothetical protein ACA30_09775 [Virgibacillus soli]|nr:hypothetical protein ACA30_09775 [Virgibacillus soli]